MYEKKINQNRQSIIQFRKKKIDDFKFVSRNSRCLQIVATENSRRHQQSKRNDYHFVFKKSRRLQTISNEEFQYQKYQFRNDVYRRDHDRFRFRSKNHYKKFRFRNHYRKFKSRFRFKFKSNHKFNQPKNLFKRKSRSWFHRSNRSKNYFRRKSRSRSRFWFKYCFRKHRFRFNSRNRYIKKKRSRRKTEFYYRFVKSVKLKSFNVMKFDFETISVAFFVKKFQHIAKIEKKKFVFRILSMCLKKSVLE